MADQLSLSLQPLRPPTDLPPVVERILRAARSVEFRVVPRMWGVEVGPKGTWVVRGDCCCPIGALLVAERAVAKRERHVHHVAAAARLLGVSQAEIYQFAAGFDRKWGEGGDGSTWYGYGRAVARELGQP